MGTYGVNRKVQESLEIILQKTDRRPRIAIVLGTGMNPMIDMVEAAEFIDYKDIPHFPKSTVVSHRGKMVFGVLGGIEVVIVAGRFHYYEGYSMDEVTYYIHVLKALGVSLSIMTSASGGLNAHYSEGEIVLIKDHINLFSDNPLRGMNDEGMGPRFVDLMRAYPVEYRDKALDAADRLGIPLKEGVYLGWQGPSLETPAEYNMANMLGADLVGMSTIPEVIINKYRGIDTLAFTIVSNVCFPLSVLTETSVEEVIKNVNINAEKLQSIILDLIMHGDLLNQS